MKKVLLISLLTLLFSGCVVHAHPRFTHTYSTTKLVVYDYAYDNYSDRWVRVNKYIDYVNCYTTQTIMSNLEQSGLYYAVTGPYNCPDKLSYSVYHEEVSYALHFDFSIWGTHHHRFHHHHVRRHFHNHHRFNTKHHYSTFAKHHQNHHRHSSGVKSHKSSKHHSSGVKSHKRNKYHKNDRRYNGKSKLHHKGKSKKRKNKSKLRRGKRGNKKHSRNRNHRQH